MNKFFENSSGLLLKKKFNRLDVFLVSGDSLEKKRNDPEFSGHEKNIVKFWANLAGVNFEAKNS